MLDRLINVKWNVMLIDSPKGYIYNICDGNIFLAIIEQNDARMTQTPSREREREFHVLKIEFLKFIKSAIQLARK